MIGIVKLADYRPIQNVPEYLRPHRRWAEAMAHRDLADAQSLVAWWNFQNAQDDFGKDSPRANAAHEAYGEVMILPRVLATSRAMMTPAPDMKALRRKLKNRKHEGGHPAWDAQIEADRMRLEGGDA